MAFETLLNQFYVEKSVSKKGVFETHKFRVHLLHNRFDPTHKRVIS